MQSKGDADFFNCGHTNTLDNRQKAGWYADGTQCYRCRQCMNRYAREFSRKKREPYLRKTAPIFPCGHPRIKSNKVWYRQYKRDHSKKYLVYRCKLCRNRFAKESRQRNKHKRKNTWIKKPKATFARGSIVVGQWYESDRQCDNCGYMLRYTRTDRCVLCTREHNLRTKAKQKIALAKRQHTRASDIHNFVKVDLTNATDLRQDASP